MKLFKKTMNNIRILSFTILILAIWFVPSYSQSPNELYQDGRTAYNASDYFNAYKNLYAYKIIMKDQISSIVETPVNEAIKHCELELYSALIVKRDLERDGKVVKVTVESEGAMDQATSPSSSIKKTNLPNFRDDYIPESEHISQDRDNNPNSKEIKRLNKVIYEMRNEYINLKTKIRTLESQKNKIAHEYRKVSKDYKELQEKYELLKKQN